MLAQDQELYVRDRHILRLAWRYLASQGRAILSGLNKSVLVVCGMYLHAYNICLVTGTKLQNRKHLMIFWLFLPHLILMQEEQFSIFDHDFLQETSIRRRSLLPLALKIYVWFFMAASGFSFMNSIYFYLRYQSLSGFELSDGIALLTIFIGLLFSVLSFLANLFILLEKKQAILFALVVVALSILFSGYSLFMRASLLRINPAGLIMEAGWQLLKAPYIIMLIKIKRAWEAASRSV